MLLWGLWQAKLNLVFLSLFSVGWRLRKEKEIGLGIGILYIYKTNIAYDYKFRTSMIHHPCQLETISFVTQTIGEDPERNKLGLF